MQLHEHLLFVDVDDCIYDTHTQFLNTLEKVFGKQARYETLKNEWEMANVLTEDELGVLWGSWTGYSSVPFQRDVKIKDNAESVLNGVRFLRHIILTDCPQGIQQLRGARLLQSFPGFTVLFTHHSLSKSDSNALTKVDVVQDMCREYGTKAIVIEDAPHHIEAMLKEECVDTIIVFTMPYNRHIKSDKIRRVTTWKEVETLLSPTSSLLDTLSTERQPALST